MSRDLVAIPRATLKQLVAIPRATLKQLVADLERLSSVESAAKNLLYVIDDLAKVPEKSRPLPLPDRVPVNVRTNLTFVCVDSLTAALWAGAVYELVASVTP